MLDNKDVDLCIFFIKYFKKKTPLWNRLFVPTPSPPFPQILDLSLVVINILLHI